MHKLLAFSNVQLINLNAHCLQADCIAKGMQPAAALLQCPETANEVLTLMSTTLRTVTPARFEFVKSCCPMQQLPGQGGPWS